ncbi:MULTISPECIES: AMP-binding protein [unclassified Nocardia]|uniref:AMP-binding protein n=1 Tax=unclassified Nocardia TaxID=2637762 RepID=UPI0024A9AF4F|nr:MULTISPECIES: AMP-binding protein [unclassified Nocardia]
MKTLSMDPVVTACNWVDLVATRVRQFGDRRAFTFLAADGRESDTLTYRDLDRRARVIADCLAEQFNRGDRVLLLYPAGLDYVTAFFGCLYAGVIAVPMPEAARNRVGQIEAVARDCVAVAVLTTYQGVVELDSPGTHHALTGLPRIATDVLRDAQDPAPRAAIDGSAVAYLQYTSGSTAAPKGVIIDHAMALHQSADMAHCWQVGRDDVIVSWLPHFHDFGHVTGVLLPVYAGCSAVLMAPSTFVKNPVRWLEAITTYRGTHSGAPNFALDLCVDKTTPQQRAELDLSSWRALSNGAEPVRKASLDRFHATFAPSGLSATALTPGYGLAEATLKVTCSNVRGRHVAVRFDRQALGLGKAEPSGAEDGIDLVGLGVTALSTELAIVDPATAFRLPDGRVGEIWVSGPAVSPGYWQRPADTAQTFGVRIEGDTRDWLRTGDLGFVHAGEMFICGRVKNMMIVNGVNYYLEDLEGTLADGHDGLRAGGVLAFGISKGGQEKLVLVAEHRPDSGVDPGELTRAMSDLVARRHGIVAESVVLIAPGTIPRTTSGKLRRQQCRNDFQAGRLSEIYRWEGKKTMTETTENQVPGPSGSTMTELVRLGLIEQVRAWMADRPGPDQPVLDLSRSLIDHGLGSVDQIDLHESLETWAGQRFAPELLWESATVEDMVRAIADTLSTVTEGGR